MVKNKERKVKIHNWRSNKSTMKKNESCKSSHHANKSNLWKSQSILIWICIFIIVSFTSYHFKIFFFWSPFTLNSYNFAQFTMNSYLCNYMRTNKQPRVLDALNHIAVLRVRNLEYQWKGSTRILKIDLLWVMSQI